MILNLSHKNPSEIYAEWDQLAPIRLKQILSGSDLTYKHVLSPTIHMMIDSEGAGNILDLGCGVGVLSHELAMVNGQVTGVDPSGASIGLAKEYFGGSAKFINATAEQYSSDTKKKYAIIVSNMVLMDALNLGTFVLAVSRLLKRGGIFVFTITHPCFWPQYYGYSRKDWFDYRKEIIVQSPFKISNQQDCRLNSTHVHRPIEMYVSAFVKAGLTIEQLSEPVPPEFIMNLYPKRWLFPRYLVGQCRLPKKL